MDDYDERFYSVPWEQINVLNKITCIPLYSVSKKNRTTLWNTNNKDVEVGGGGGVWVCVDTGVAI